MQIEAHEIERYRKFREIGRELNGVLLGYVGKMAFKKAAKELGLLRDGAIVFENDSAVAVFQDYSIHTYRMGGRSLFDICLTRESHTLDPDMLVLLEMYRHSLFSVFKVKETDKYYCCDMLDVVSGKEYPMLDFGFAETAPPGSLLVTRLIPVPGSVFFMSSGAAIPAFNQATLTELKQIIGKFIYFFLGGGLSPSQEASFCKQITRTLLRMGMLERVSYLDI
ncbi:MAG: hypothetical protein H7834_14430 [Magnetococcus sp. YQC-9]